MIFHAEDANRTGSCHGYCLESNSFADSWNCIGRLRSVPLPPFCSLPDFVVRTPPRLVSHENLVRFTLVIIRCKPVENEGVEYELSARIWSSVRVNVDPEPYTH